MAQQHANRHTTVTDEDRREFLKALGVTGAVAASGVTVSELHSSLTPGATEELAPVGQAIASELTGSLDAGLIREGQAGVAAAAAELPASLEAGLPEVGSAEPRTGFAAVAEPAWPVYDHLRDVGFYESSATHLPAFGLETLAAAESELLASEQLVGVLEGFGLGEEVGVDLLATVIANGQQLQNHHWVANEEIPGQATSIGDAFPSAPQAAAGGGLLWLGDLDLHLWQKTIILTEGIHADAVWHGQSMAAGFYLMSEAAAVIAEGGAGLSDAELGSLLTTSFAVQAISQGLLPQDVYWVTEEMRKPSALR